MKLDERDWQDGDDSIQDLADGRIRRVRIPTYEVMRVSPDKLRDWEELFTKNVGMRPDKSLANRWSGDPKETISGSNDDWDDCDYW